MGHNISAQLFCAPFLGNVRLQLVVYFHKVEFRALVLKHWWIEILRAFVAAQIFIIVVYALVYWLVLPSHWRLILIFFSVYYFLLVTFLLSSLLILIVYLRLPHGLSSDLVESTQVPSASAYKRVIVTSPVQQLPSSTDCRTDARPDIICSVSPLGLYLIDARSIVNMLVIWWAAAPALSLTLDISIGNRISSLYLIRVIRRWWHRLLLLHTANQRYCIAKVIVRALNT